MRFKIYPISNPECTEINESNLQGETDDLSEAGKIASRTAYPWGGAILDTQDGSIDFGDLTSGEAAE